MAVEAVFELMKIRPQSERAFELAKAGLGFEKRHVELPELRGSEALVLKAVPCPDSCQRESEAEA